MMRFKKAYTSLANVGWRIQVASLALLAVPAMAMNDSSDLHQEDGALMSQSLPLPELSGVQEIVKGEVANQIAVLREDLMDQINENVDKRVDSILFQENEDLAGTWTHGGNKKRKNFKSAVPLLKTKVFPPESIQNLGAKYETEIFPPAKVEKEEWKNSDDLNLGVQGTPRFVAGGGERWKVAIDWAGSTMMTGL